MNFTKVNKKKQTHARDKPSRAIIFQSISTNVTILFIFKNSSLFLSLEAISFGAHREREYEDDRQIALRSHHY